MTLANLKLKNAKQTNGFTLIELSIVLLIIGLLIGGMLVGQSLIDSAKIVKIASKLQQYTIAINNFNLKYKQVPGDSNYFAPKGNFNWDPNSIVADCGEPEWQNVFAHLSTSGMVTDNLVSICNSPISTTYFDSRNAGVVYPLFPSTVPWDNSALGITGSKPVIQLLDYDLSQRWYVLYYYYPATEVIGLERKMGAINLSAANRDAVFNGFGNAGTCGDISANHVTCGDPTAFFGQLVISMSIIK